MSEQKAVDSVDNHDEGLNLIMDGPLPAPNGETGTVGVTSETVTKTSTRKTTKASRPQAPLPEGYMQEQDRWEYLRFAARQGYTVEGRVDKVTFPANLNTAVWELDLGSVKGICPLSETGLEDQALMMRYVGQTVRVKIVKLDRENRIAACSRREALADARERLFAALRPDQVIDVVVRAVLDDPPRLVVDVGGGVLVDVSRAQATLSRTGSLDRLFRPGQQARAKVIQVDRQTDVIRVSLSAVEAYPWRANSYQRGDIVAATVVTQRDGLLFLEVQPGLIGIASPPLRGRLRNGERVACMVTAYDPGVKKLHLQLRGRLA